MAGRTKVVIYLLKSRYGDAPVPIVVAYDEMRAGKKMEGKPRAYGIERHFPLGEYIDTLFTETREAKGYMASHNLIKQLPALARDIAFPRYHGVLSMKRLSCWLGVGGTKVHCDYAHNLFVQVVGGKCMQLYAPDTMSSHCPVKETWYSCFSLIDFDYFKPNAHEKQELQSLRPDYTVVVEPGDILFIPYGWWHRTITPEPSVSVNRWWVTPRMLLGRKIWQARWASRRLARRALHTFHYSKP